MKYVTLILVFLMTTGCTSQMAQKLWGISPVNLPQNSLTPGGADNSSPPDLNLPSAATGLFFGAIGKTVATTGTCSASGVNSTWCTGGSFSSGTGDGMLSAPMGIAVDNVNGFFYVADENNNRVAKFDLASGAFVGAIGGTSSSTGTCPASGAAPGWCTGGVFALGSTDGVMNYPQGVAVDPAHDFLYVADAGNNRVQKFVLSTGAFVGAIGGTSSSTGTCPASGAAPGWCTGGNFVQMNADGYYVPFNVTIDATNGFLYVVDFLKSIRKVNLSTGAFIGAVGKTSASSGTCPAGAATTGWCTGGTFTADYFDGGLGFTVQSSLVLDPAHDYFYVTDDFKSRVDRFVLSTGVFAGALGNMASSSGTCPGSGVATGWCTGGNSQSGNVDGAFFKPRGLMIDVSRDILYVADGGNRNVIKLTASTGAFIGAIGYTTGTTGTCPASGIPSAWCTGGTFRNSSGSDGGFTIPVGIALNGDGSELFILDMGSARLSKFK